MYYIEKGDVVEIKDIKIDIARARRTNPTKEKMVKVLRAGKVDVYNRWLQFLKSKGCYNPVYGGRKYNDFTDVDFFGCNLDGVNFAGARLVGASFLGASLRYADLDCANILDADFRGCDTSYAKKNVSGVPWSYAIREDWQYDKMIQRLKKNNGRHVSFYRERKYLESQAIPEGQTEDEYSYIREPMILGDGTTIDSCSNIGGIYPAGHWRNKWL